MRHIILLVALQFSIPSFSQVLYSERFNTLSMNTGTYSSGGVTQTYLYKDVPSGMVMINGGGLTADTLSGNYPFRTSGQKQKAWMAYKHPSTADTFAVSTSWLNPQGTADAWLITPIISNIAANTVLTWEAIAPDRSNSDGYEVIVSTSTSSNTSIADFTTNNRVFFTSAESGSWVTHGVSLSAYAGQNIRLAFRNNSANKYQLWIDDIVVKNVSSTYDVAAISNDTYKYSTINKNNVISASFRNNGSAPVTSMVLNYQVGSNAVVTETQNFSVPLNYLESSSYNFALLYSSPSAGYNTVKVWVSSVNGQNDQVQANDTAATGITLSTAIPAKKVLVEEFTSVTCPICPDAFMRLRDIAITNTNVIATSVHSSDSLTAPVGGSLTASFAEEGSSAMIDRYYYPGVGKITSGRNQWQTYIDQRLAMVVPAGVNVSGVTYNQATRQINADVSATFVGDVKGDYRLNLYIKENNIYGPIMDITDNGWNQYSNLFNIQSSPFYQVGYYLDASTNLLGPNQYSHQFVINEFLDGPYGAAGIIPANGSTGGQSYTKSYSYTLPTALHGEYRYNPDNIYLVGIVSEYGTAAVLNAFEVKLTSNPELPVGMNELSKQESNMTLYPNPSADRCFVSYTSSRSQEVRTEIYNMLGELVYEHADAVSEGNMVQQIDCSSLSEGNYHVVLKFKDHSVSKKLTVIK